jgi:hypothetical protein
MLRSALFRRPIIHSVFTLLLFVLLAGAAPALKAQNCCNNGITRVSIAPVSDDGEQCCFRVYGTAWCTSATIYSIDIQEWSFGSWITAGPSTPITAPYNFSMTLCKPRGHHVFRLVFKDYDGQPLCTKEIAYDCGTVDCCENMSVRATGDQNNPDNCCYIVSGNVLQCPAAAHYTIEYWSDDKWQLSGEGNILDRFNPWFNSDVICLPRVNSPYKFRVTLRDVLGNVMCTRELTASCNYTPCCDNFNFEVVPETSNDPKLCCFTLKGAESYLCGIASDYSVEEQVNGEWRSLTGGYIRLQNKSFQMRLCRTKGSYHFRVILRSDGRIYCVKEVSYTCEDECCQSLRVIQGDVVRKENCCQVTFAIVPDKCSGKVSTFEVEKYTFGEWKNDLQAYIIDPNSLATSYSSCVPLGTTTIRFIFRGTDGEITCVREVDFECTEECCDLLSVEVSKQVDIPGKCCFDFSLNVPECLRAKNLIISEMNRSGRWVKKQSGTITGGSSVLRYCLSPTALTPARVRFAFCDDDGNIICAREFTLDCWYTNNPNPGDVIPPGKMGNGESNDLPSDISAADMVSGLAGIPNPAIDETLLSYTLAQDAMVIVELVDALGQKTPVQSVTMQSRGSHSLSLSTHNLAAGMYTVVVRANGVSATLKLMVVR